MHVELLCSDQVGERELIWPWHGTDIEPMLPPVLKRRDEFPLKVQQVAQLWVIRLHERQAYASSFHSTHLLRHHSHRDLRPSATA